MLAVAMAMLGALVLGAASAQTLVCKEYVNMTQVGNVVNAPLLPVESNTTGRASTEDSYDYASALEMSILFYEAQQSGKLPAWNRVSWRGDSHLDDAVPGGVHDAGDHLKNSYSLSTAVALIAWGMADFAAGVDLASQTQNARNNLRWMADWLYACHLPDGSYVLQIADTNVDHSYWGRPEDQSGPRAVFAFDGVSQPASDLFGSASAALTATSLAFGSVDPAYAAKLLDKAKQLYKTATAVEGRFGSSPVAGSISYTSSKYLDRLAWAAAWLYRATGSAAYLGDASNYYARAVNYKTPAVNWDGIYSAVSVLLATTPGTAGLEPWTTDARQFVQSWVAGNGGVTYTAKGLALDGNTWGTLREACNAAMLALVMANGDSDAARGQATANWARTQVDYALGSAGRSYLVGFGANYPGFAHHRAASCPDPPATCGWDQFYSKAPNPHVLLGGLVGGPASSDDFQDDRQDYQTCEVGVEYQGGLVSALAAILNGLVPPTTTTPAPAPPPPIVTAQAPAPAALPTILGDALFIGGPSGGNVSVAIFGQCGGSSGCPAGVTNCSDDAWRGYQCVPCATCPPLACKRQQLFYWQCMPAQ